MLGGSEVTPFLNTIGAVEDVGDAVSDSEFNKVELIMVGKSGTGLSADGFARFDILTVFWWAQAQPMLFDVQGVATNPFALGSTVMP